MKLLGFQLRVWSSMTDELTIAAVAVAVDVPLIGGIQSLPRKSKANASVISGADDSRKMEAVPSLSLPSPSAGRAATATAAAKCLRILCELRLISIFAMQPTTRTLTMGSSGASRGPRGSHTQTDKHVGSPRGRTHRLIMCAIAYAKHKCPLAKGSLADSLTHSLSLCLCR